MNLFISLYFGDNSLLMRAVSNRSVLLLHMILKVIVKGNLPQSILLAVVESLLRIVLVKPILVQHFAERLFGSKIRRSI